jgi:hypothetical protein
MEPANKLGDVSRKPETMGLHVSRAVQRLGSSSSSV